MIKINNTMLPISPSNMAVGIKDIDNSETSVRTADAKLNRDRVAIKRQIKLDFPIMHQSKMSQLLQLVRDEFFEVEYMDPESATLQTKRMYSGDREPEVAFVRNGIYYWKEFKLILTEG
jgi:hypothetical protein